MSDRESQTWCFFSFLGCCRYGDENNLDYTHAYGGQGREAKGREKVNFWKTPKRILIFENLDSKAMGISFFA